MKAWNSMFLEWAMNYGLQLTITIVGLSVMGKPTSSRHTIIYLQVADSHKSQSVGSALLRAAIDACPESEFVVIPFDGTDEFYRRLGFEKSGRWEMRRPPLSTEGKAEKSH